LLLQYAAAFTRILAPRPIVLPRMSGLRQSRLLPYVCVALVVLLALLSHFVWTRGDLHQCLIDGAIVQSCVKKLAAKSF
jgi:hypothetical protein